MGSLTDAHGARWPLRPALLLLEPCFVLRRTVVSVVQSLQLADICEASSPEAARLLLGTRRFDAFVFALGDTREELPMIQQVRDGQSPSASSAPVAVMTQTCDAALVKALRDLNVARVMLKPFKVKTIADTIKHLADPQV